MSGAKANGICDAGCRIGVDRSGDDQNVVAGPGAGLGDAGVKPVFGSNDDNDSADEDDAYGASASFVSGSAAITAFASNNDDQDHCGIGAALDPGRRNRGTDLPAAESVRPKHKLEAGDMCTFDVKVDGSFHQDRQLKIAKPPEPGRMIAGQVA